MVRRKTAASSVAAVTVYRDESGDSDNNNDDNTSQHLPPPPPRKKTRLSKEPPVVTAAPRARRAALKEKAANPSSSDLRPVDQNGEKLQKVKGSTLPVIETAAAPDLETKKTSPLHEASIVGGPVYRELKRKLSEEDFGDLLSLLRENAAQGAADLIAKKGCWFPELLNCFRASDLTSLDFSSPSSPSGVFIPHQPPGLTLQVLFQQHQFSALTAISFRKTPLINDDVAFLRLLPSLTDVDITETGLGTQSLHHLVCHRHRLEKLNLSDNPSIDDDSRVALSAFPRLIALHLRGTSFTMPGLRRLVSSDISKSFRLITIPGHCLEYINTRGGRYMVDIPVDYALDPDRVAEMTVPNLKKNLGLHAKVNKDVQVTGTKIELIDRLRSILSNRVADSKIINALAGPEK